MFIAIKVLVQTEGYTVRNNGPENKKLLYLESI